MRSRNFTYELNLVPFGQIKKAAVLSIEYDQYSEYYLPS